MFTKLFPPSPSRLTRVVLVAALSLSLFVPLVSGLLTALAGWLALLAQVATCLFVVSAGVLGSTLLLALAAWCAARRAAAPNRPDVGP